MLAYLHSGQNRSLAGKPEDAYFPRTWRGVPGASVLSSLVAGPTLVVLLPPRRKRFKSRASGTHVLTCTLTCSRTCSHTLLFPHAFALTYSHCSSSPFELLLSLTLTWWVAAVSTLGPRLFLQPTASGPVDTLMVDQSKTALQDVVPSPADSGDPSPRRRANLGQNSRLFAKLSWYASGPPFLC